MENNEESELFLPPYELPDFQKNPGLMKRNQDALLLHAKALQGRNNAYRKENRELERKTIEQNAEILILKRENEDIRRENENLSKSNIANLIVAFLGIFASACTSFGINYVTSNRDAWYGWVLLLVGIFFAFGGILAYVIITFSKKK